MYINNGITVEFAYSEREKKKYQQAEKAFHDYKFNAELKSRSSFSVEYKRKKIIKFILILFFMFYQMILLLKSFSEYMAENSPYSDWGYNVTDASNTIGFICTVIIFILVIGFRLSNKEILGDTIFEVLGEFIKCFIKACLSWIVLFILLYVLSFFFSKDSTLYKKLDQKLLQVFGEIQKEENINNQAEGGINIQDIEQDINELNNNSEQLMQNEMIYKDRTFEIIVEVSKIYIYPTDYGHMYEAIQGAQFVATGNEFVGEDGALWYEFYTNSEKTNKAWIKATEIQFK